MPASPPRELRHSPSTPASLSSDSQPPLPPSSSQQAVKTLATWAEDTVTTQSSHATPQPHTSNAAAKAPVEPPAQPTDLSPASTSNRV
mmetsp:Transcript_6098/g.16988  ORF Transcript_6098/g.16988 Transcript_6098/m.16988 type:complete len:88 (-) Transcript_6098:217-480(-)